MKIRLAFLRSRVARRIFSLFVLCALIPITVLALITYNHVSGQLREQSLQRLRLASKSTGMSIMERIVFVSTALRAMLVEGNQDGWAVQSAPDRPEEAPYLPDWFRSLHRDDGRGGYVGLVGPALPSTLDSLFLEPSSSESKLRVVAGENESRIFLEVSVPNRGKMLAEIEPVYLWGDERALPPMTELCVLNELDEVLFCSDRALASAMEDLAAAGTFESASGRLEMTAGGNERLGAHWSLPLFALGAKQWRIVLSEPRDYVELPMAQFLRSFPLLFLMTLWIVLLLSIQQIRRSLVPLEELKEGTHRIARRDFTLPVAVTSGDEFEDLATSFNTMAAQLGRQFHSLATMAEIDRAILSSLSTQHIVETILRRTPEILPCRIVSIGLVDRKNDLRLQIWGGVRDGAGRLAPIPTTMVEVGPAEIKALWDNSECLELTGSPPSYVQPNGSPVPPDQSWLVFPVFSRDKLAGVLSLGNVQTFEDMAQNEDARGQLRRLGNQLGVAFANAELVEELDALNWGALVALARTIDAKSPWTAGHSERAAALAVRMGKRLGLEAKELDALHRGALLHDIGKIGIPPSILDKPGKLDPEEIQVMRQHPLIGRRILEPIEAYAEVIPVVSQHHEWFDGSGYPDGLSGQAIHFNARIYAVADVFDALFADRPYRAGLERQKVVDYIVERSGTQFDPEVVDAFLRVVQEEELLSPGQLVPGESVLKNFSPEGASSD